MERKRVVAEGHTLLHPFSMRKELLQELMPSNFAVDEVLESISAKQKEIARRLRVSVLLGEKSLGMLGQAALFEILRNRGFNFRSYLTRFSTKWERSKTEGFELLFTLGYIHYLRRFFGHTPIDLVQYLLEPVTRYQFSITWDGNWVTRPLTDIFSVSPCTISNKQIHQILTHLMCIQDARGLTTTRVMDWTGRSRSESSHLVEILRASGVEHRYRIVSKNSRTVKVLAKSQSKWKSVPSFFSACTSLMDDEGYFLSLNDVFKKDADGKYFEMEAMNTNVELYDLKDQSWKLNSSPQVTRSVDDIYALIQNGDHTIPDNKFPPTRRDMFFIALLSAIYTRYYSNKKQEIMKWFTKGYELPKEEIEQGVRSVLQKNLLRHQYSHSRIMEDRDVFSVVFDDKSKKVIPFLGEVLQNLPFFSLQIDAEMGYGHLVDFHPSYLTCDLRNLIESSMNEHQVNGELFVLHSWGFGEPGSILQLLPDD
ncbi:MAG: hypothetical protein ACW98Y_08635 [Candidatus Thorarchaeota archaeon]